MNYLRVVDKQNDMTRILKEVSQIDHSNNHNAELEIIFTQHRNILYHSYYNVLSKVMVIRKTRPIGVMSGTYDLYGSTLYRKHQQYNLLLKTELIKELVLDESTKESEILRLIGKDDILKSFLKSSIMEMMEESFREKVQLVKKKLEVIEEANKLSKEYNVPVDKWKYYTTMQSNTTGKI